MRYSTQPKSRKHVECYGVLSFARNLKINMVEN